VRVGLRLAEVGEVEELDNMELMVGYWDSLADSLLDILGACDMLAFELVATFEPLDDMAGAVDMLAIESVAGLYSLDEALETVMAGTMGLVIGFDLLLMGFDSLLVGFDSLLMGFDSLLVGFDSLGEDLETVMEETMEPVAGFDSLVADFESLDEPLEAVMTGTMGLVADDTTGAVGMLTFELAGHTDDLEDILRT
jgi:hypothetical protein